MAILINDNYSLQACKPFDARYLNICSPWTSVGAVNTAIPTYRYTGLTVNIMGTEYWYKNGIGNGDLIPKSLGGGGTLSGATNGLHLINSGTTVVLGGALTGDTTINASGFTLHVNNGYLSTNSGYQISGTTMFRTLPSSLSSIFIGSGSGSGTGICNIAIGNDVFPYNTTGACNIGIGSQTLNQNTTGKGNVAIGRFSLGNTMTGCTNVAIGDNTLFNLRGDNNVGIGVDSMCLHACGCNNVAIGYKAMAGTSPGTYLGNNNIAIGYMAGKNETGSNRLHIANSSGASLIYGDFSTKCVQIGGQLKITGVTSGSTSDSILVWNSGDKLVKKVSPTSMVGLTGATNGLSTSGQKVVLGGDLTGNTCICTLNHCLSIGCSINSELTVNSTAISAFHCTNASNGSSISIYNTGLTLSNKISSVSCSVTLGQNALIYDGCYHNCYINRTLVDKEYVDKQVSGCSNMIKIKNVFGCTYNATIADDIIAVSGQSNCPIYLPITPVLINCRGQRITVVDICGCALIDPIIINGNGKLINNGTCSTINTDYGSVTFVYNGYFWSAIAFVN